MKFFYLIIFLFSNSILLAQKDSLQIGDKYADDQLYFAISYAQLSNQPTIITRSRFSYAISAGFLKDIILNKRGNISIAAGIGYGYNSFDHKLKVETTASGTQFSDGSNLSSNVFSAHNIEFPLEFRWRTSTVNKYKFWRIYTGIKFLYNFSNTFDFTENSTNFSFSNISAYRKFQYGLTLSAGYNEFNFHVFYGLTPIFENAIINSEEINTRILKFGIIFYIL